MLGVPQVAERDGVFRIEGFKRCIRGIQDRSRHTEAIQVTGKANGM